MAHILKKWKSDYVTGPQCVAPATVFIWDQLLLLSFLESGPASKVTMYRELCHAHIR